MAINTTPRYQYDPAADAAGKKAQTAAEAQRQYAIQQARARMESAKQMAGGGFGGAGGNQQLQEATRAYNAAVSAGIPGNPGALDEVAQAEQQTRDATFGRGDQIENDPRLTAAMDALDPTKAQGNAYAQMSDANAAGAGSQAEMLRQQMAAAGISLNDPAAQARLRGIETARLQGNNAALGQSQQAGQGAASQLAQVRLAQFGAGQQAYSQGVNWLTGKVFGQQNVSSGVRPQVQNQGFGQQQTNQMQPWQAPNQLLSNAEAASKGIDAAMAKNTSTQTPSQVPSQNVPQAGANQTWGQALQTYDAGRGTGSITPQSNAAQSRLQQLLNSNGVYKKKAVSWDPSGYEDYQEPDTGDYYV